ncbi:hypothetical protein ABZ471_22730 [Streptomyces sp. NPDC005728]|uniref:hypothetical protein n=1 Tax=Streptomyces sp. NPDC005728 TaxID=3157054 RepID=UPI00340FA34F
MVTAREDGAQGRRGHLSPAGMRARGWTAGLVRRLLGEPDLLRDNPYTASAPRTRLYRVERVEAAEQSAEFRAVAAAVVRRSVAARAVVRRRREVRARLAAEQRAAGGDMPESSPRSDSGAESRPSSSADEAVSRPPRVGEAETRPARAAGAAEIRVRRSGRAADDQEVVHPRLQEPP